MTSLSRSSSKKALGAGARIFNVLGRIDEESSFRASLCNITSQDSSPRSSNDSSTDDECGSNDWQTAPPSPPESYRTTQAKASIDFANTTIGGGNSSIHQTNHRNVTVVTTVTNLEDNPLSTEHRQDMPQSYVPLPSLQSSSTVSLQRKHQQQQQDPRQEQRNRKEDKAERIQRENEELQKECEQLESLMLQIQTESNVIQMRTAHTMKNYERQIDQARKEKERLLSQCQDLEDRILDLRREIQAKQKSIWDAEEQLQRQRRKQQQRNQETSAVGEAK